MIFAGRCLAIGTSVILSLALVACTQQGTDQARTQTTRPHSNQMNVQQVRTTATQTATIVSRVNFRTGPSTAYRTIRKLQPGEKVTIIGQPNSYWYSIRDANGRTGYTSSRPQYIRVSGTAAPTPATPAPAPAPGTGTGTGASAPATSTLAQRVIDAGMKYWGTPYEFGSNRNTTTTFDCSDFVKQAFKEGAGIVLPADSRQQATYVQNIGKTTTDWRQLKPGDIMFFMSYRGSNASSYAGINKSAQRITHDGIYIGNGKILHTYSPESGGVRTNTIAGTHWEYRFVFGGSAFR